MAIKSLSKRPWLLLPGTLCTGAVFDKLLDTLGVDNAYQTVVPLDRPAVEDYYVDFDGLSEETIVCGFSLGAIVAAHAANRMNVKTLILFGLNPFADAPSKATLRHDLARDVAAMGGAAALKSRTPNIYGPNPDKTRQQIYQMADDTAHLIDVQTTLALTRPGALPALEQSRMQVLSLTGSHDSAAPTDEGLAAAQAAPHGRFRCLEGLGHFALLEDPNACAASLIEMMEAKEHEPHCN